VLRSSLNFLRHLRGDDPHRWYPVLSVVYLTYACRFRCPYCSDGAQNPYYALRASTLGADAMLELLRAVRRHCSCVVLTGGEPLQHPDIDDILEAVPSLRYGSVVLTTNGHDLDRHLGSVARSVTDLVVSLDTLDHTKADRAYGVGSGTLARILENVEQARRVPGRRFHIVISLVVTPDTLDDVDDVRHYARQRGFQLAVCPQLVGVKAHPDLARDPRYLALFDRLIEDKRRGEDIYGTVPYLRAMRNLERFSCRPFTMLVVSPTGDVFYPCLEKGTFAGNLLHTEDLHALRREGHRRHGPQPHCGVQCHSACALGFATALGSPGVIAHEGYLQAKSRAVRLSRALASRTRGTRAASF
jgi:MoaA/NifB/PqqE/SkfB family radical SAM enzyme